MPVKYNGEYCHFLGVISDKDNFAIAVSILENGPINFSDLRDELGFRRNFLAGHLKKLISCSYIFSKKVGREKLYYLNTSTVLPLIKIIKKHIRKHRTGR